MLGDRCIVCGSSRAKDPSASFHHFPSDLSKKQLWIDEFGLLEASVKPFTLAGLSGMATQQTVQIKQWALDLRLLKSEAPQEHRELQNEGAFIPRHIIATISMPKHYGIQTVRLNECQGYRLRSVPQLLLPMVPLWSPHLIQQTATWCHSTNPSCLG